MTPHFGDLNMRKQTSHHTYTSNFFKQQMRDNQMYAPNLAKHTLYETCTGLKKKQVLTHTCPKPAHTRCAMALRCALCGLKCASHTQPNELRMVSKWRDWVQQPPPHHTDSTRNAAAVDVEKCLFFQRNRLFSGFAQRSDLSTKLRRVEGWESIYFGKHSFFVIFRANIEPPPLWDLFGITCT